jgi:glycosyltransferase involved in cell wall biosynthesis
VQDGLAGAIVAEERQSIVFVTPSLKLSGGNLEVARLSAEFTAAGHRVQLMPMWRSLNPMTSELSSEPLTDWPPRPILAGPQMPWLVGRFARRLRRLPPKSHIVLTHYATLPLAPFVSSARRWLFVQDLEWTFMPPGLLRSGVARIIKFAFHHHRLISANPYLTAELRALGHQKLLEAPIWASPSFWTEPELERTYDTLVILRKGAHKRLDLCFEFIQAIRRVQPGVRIAAVTTEDGHAGVRPFVSELFIRLSRDEMRKLYAATRTIVLLSDHEGFGLPPLEAMGAGCVPLCRDSGGPRNYMTGPMRDLLLPLNMPVSDIVVKVASLLADKPRLARLSREAQTIFRSGLENAELRRSELAASGLPKG